MRITIRMPRVLSELTRCERLLELELQERAEGEGSTVGAALAELVRLQPKLAIHLFDETGGLRRHVLCFCNAVQSDTRAKLDQPLVRGDCLTLVNSVAGG